MTELETLVKELFTDFLDYKEVDSNGKVFYPISISCCRAAKLERLDKILVRMKQLTETPENGPR